MWFLRARATIVVNDKCCTPVRGGAGGERIRRRRYDVHTVVVERMYNVKREKNRTRSVRVRVNRNMDDDK